MACSKEVLEYNNITDILTSTFGEICSREAIYSIVESCSGDLNHAANVIMSITSEENKVTNAVESLSYSPNIENTHQPIANVCEKNTSNQAKAPGISLINTIDSAPTNSPHSLPTLSYVEVSKTKKTRTMSKQMDNSYKSVPKRPFQSNWTEQTRRIVKYHNEGVRNLIIMRGVPGSGKTYLARAIQEMTVGPNPEYTHIYSTDDYFMVNGNYMYNRANLGVAHEWNQSRACKALNNGISPVIIDNTNIEIHEIFPYARAGIFNGYILEIVEPNTHWARDLRQLAHRNVHAVPKSVIERMLERLQGAHVSSAYFVAKMGYPSDKQPPVLRCLPKIFSSGNIHGTAEQTSTNNKIKVGGNESMSLMMQTNLKHTEICTEKSSNIKYNVTGENQISQEVVIVDNSELSCNTVTNNFQTKIASEIQENVVLIEATNFNNMIEGKNKTSLPEHIQQSESKMSLEKSKQFSHNEKDFKSLMSTENEDTLKEIDKIQDSNSFVNSGNDKNSFDKFVHDFENVEIEWDNGEAWEENSDASKKEPLIQLDPNLDAKLPRPKKNKDNKTSVPLDSDNDWRKMYMPVASTADNNSPSNLVERINVQTTSIETCMEIGDTEISKIKDGFKILSAVPRDININYIPSFEDKIPERRMLDKSSMTNENNFMLGSHRCKNEESHFKEFRKMFMNYSKKDLRHVFDNCCGDVNWAVSIVLDSNMIENKIKGKSLDEKTDTESEEEEVLDFDNSCNCIAHYDIVPDTSTVEEIEHDIPSPTTDTDISNFMRPKQKKSLPISDTSLSLKRQIEQNIVISDQHYSEACLKVRKMRRGELDVIHDDISSQCIGTGITMDTTNESDLHTILINEPNKTNEKIISGSSTIDVDSGDSDNEPTFNQVNKTVNVNLGHEFLNQLDMIFGRTDLVYPDNIEPKICMPMSLLVEINALWMQSMMYQLETQSKSREEMIKQDEEFARELAMKEIKISQSGKKPEVPNLSEIMDMEKALALYRKDCEVSMEKDRPTDLAAKLSAKKLYDLFPELPQKDLDEILMAHDFNFQNTVMVLLKTQGRNDIIETENGVNKFIMAQELKRQELFLAAEKKRLMEENWPALPSTIDMEIVKGYRDKAKQYLERKDEYYVTAKGKLEDNYLDKLASNYKTLSELYMLRCEQANYIVAASVLQLQANKDQSTLDLHFMPVKEALETTDMFLDSHILRLRQLRERRYDLVFLITGRGLHSQRGPVIKPAVKKRLHTRGLHYRESNPGLIAVNISAGDELACHVP